MNKFFKRCILLCLAVTCMLTVMVAFASPATTEPIEYIQPDGTKVEYYIYGDEYYSFFGDEDGYLLKFDNTGLCYYATSDESEPVIYSSASVRPEKAVRGFDLRPQVNLTPADVDGTDFEIAAYSTDSSLQTYIISPENYALEDRKLMVVAVEFSDVAFSSTYYPSQLLHERFFSKESGVASVYNYYDEVSQGKFHFCESFTLDDIGDFVSDSNTADETGVVANGVVKVKLNRVHPDPCSTGTYNTLLQQDIAKDALTIVDDYIDFSVYDVDSSRQLEGDELTFIIVVAGYEGSYGYTNNSVWGVRSSLDEPLNVDGVEILGKDTKGFTMHGAMYKAEVPLGIGTACHELAHSLGLPDLYNLANPEYDFSKISYASLMNSGGHGRAKDGVADYMPTHMDPWCKLFLGWYDEGEVITIDETYKGVLKLKAPTDDDSVEGYRLIKVTTSADPNEYYLVEYRKLDGFDRGMYAYNYSNKVTDILKPGVAVWHIDDTINYKGMNNTHECGIALLHSGTKVSGTNASTGAIVEDRVVRDGFYHVANPFWSSDSGRLPFFGVASFPNNELNTVNGTKTSTGVGMDFLTKSDAPVAEVKFGGSKVNTAIRVDGYHFEYLYYFNNTDSAISVRPYIVSITNDQVQTITQNRIWCSVPAKGLGSLRANTLFDDGVTYKLFNWDFDIMEPNCPVFEHLGQEG